MGYLSNKELQDRLRHAEGLVEVGARYFHHKKPNFDPYTVKELIIIEDTMQPGIVYEPTGSGGIRFIRTLENFTEQVEVDGQMVPRFKKAE